MHNYFIVRVPDQVTAEDARRALWALADVITYAEGGVTPFPDDRVAVADITGEADYIGQIDRLYNGPDDEVDYEAADEIRTSVGDDLYDAFSDLVPGADGHAS